MTLHEVAPKERLRNKRTGTTPLAFHAQGYHTFKPAWPTIRNWVFGCPPQTLGQRPRVTLITCNNGHDAMGLFEESAARLGIPVLVAGQEYPDWVNAIHKPAAIITVLAKVETPYVIYADSRDAIIAGDPELMVDCFLREFDADLVFGACQMSWPNAPDLTDFERKRPEALHSDYKHLNGGLWIGRTEQAKAFYTFVASLPPHPSAVESEQGKLRVAFQTWYPRLQLDVDLKLFHNVGFLFEDPYEVVEP